MIRNQWYIILESNEVRSGRPIGVTRMGEKMVLWRSPEGKITCMVDRCPHLGAQLSQGKLCGDRLACPFHAFEYDASGQCCYIPALGKAGIPPKAMQVDIFPTFEAHGYIWIWWGDPRPDLPQPPFIADIDSSFSYAGYRDPWPVHYSRMVENQLDVVHLPHVHYNTIGRGNRIVVDGPVYTLGEDNILRLWVYNRVDDGIPPRKPDELPPPQRPPFLEFYFPNLWQNRISDDLRIVVAFVPVDEENGIFYLRYYQRMVKLPLLRGLVNWFGVLGSRYIANQDKRVVSNQIPKKTDLHMGEKVLPCDRLIVAYRRRRKDLQEST
ncbi:MAG: aromatic ring-hydroxylating dioxygenase subunit alpha [Anaerolineaceae bacterium]|nr:aromatic ring-hydroxylating dioxygenase subunit alpha [Anaerolineaceae bacterium]